MKKRPLLLTACLLAAGTFAQLSHAADTSGGWSARPAPVAAPTDHLGAARQAIKAKNWDLALRELNTAAQDDPRNADVQNLLGYSLRKKPNPDLPRAFEHYKAALQLDPRHKGAHEYIGEAYLMDRQPAEAEKHLAQLEQICGKGCEEYQDLAKAIAEYKAKN